MSLHGNNTNAVLSDSNSSAESSKSNCTVNFSCPQNMDFTTNSSIQSSVTNSAKMPSQFIRNPNLTHSPQIRLNVQNGNVDFNSPQISPLNDSIVTKNNEAKNIEMKTKSKNMVDNITDLGVKKHVLKSFSSSSLPSSSSPSSSFSSPFANLKSNSNSNSISNEILNEMYVSSKSTEIVANEEINFMEVNKGRKSDLNILSDDFANNVEMNDNGRTKGKEKNQENDNEFLHSNSKNEMKTSIGTRNISLPFQTKVQGTSTESL